MRIGKLHIESPRATHHVQSFATNESDNIAKAFSDSVQFMTTNFNFEKYRGRNYTADLQIMKGYIKSPLGAICVSRYQMAYPEPDLRAFENDKPSSDKLLNQILLKPNPWMSHSDIARSTISNQLWTGNCYWLKAKKGKKLVGWFPFNDTNITPFGTKDEFIAGYKFITFDGHEVQYAPEDVIHLPWVYINPLFPNRGIGPGALADILIDTDTKLDQHIAAFIANNARPDILLKLDPRYAALTKAQTISQATMKLLKREWQNKHQGDFAGDVGILPPGWGVETVGSSLQEMALDAVRATPETRTFALYLIPPEVAGGTSGQTRSTENNLAEGRVRWTTNTLVPLWKYNADKFTAGIQSDFPGVTLKYNLEGVQSLREMTNATLAGQAQQLAAFITGASTGTMDMDMAREGVKYIYNMPDETALKIFPKQPPRSNVTVDSEGALVDANSNS